MDQSRLNPQEQTTLFELLKKSGQQPTSGGMPQNVEDPGAQLSTSLFGQAPSVAPTDRMDPEEAMRQIAGSMIPSQPQTGALLQRDDAGQLYAETPSANPILKLFGKKDKVQTSSLNYYDSLVNQYGKDVVNTLVPGETPVTPEGKPFISEKTLTRLERLLPSSKVSENDKPNPAIGKLALAKLEKTYGVDSPVYKNAKEYMQMTGGLPLAKFSEFVNTSMKEETPNIFKGANGLYQVFDRVTGAAKVLPGQTVGVLEALNDPASAKMFDTKLQDFRSDPVAKQLSVTLDALSNSSRLLEANNPAALGSFFGNIARSVGLEKGPLNEGDIQRSVGDSAFGSQLYRWLNKRGLTVEDFGKGKFSDADLKDFRGLIRDMGKAADDRYEQLLQRHVDSTVKTIPGLTPDYVKGAFDTSNRFIEAENRRLPGEATNFKTPTKPKSDPLGLF